MSIDNIKGTWSATEFESEIPNLPEEYQDEGKKEFLSSVYTLNEDNSMEMHSDYFREGASGHWEFNPEVKEISLFYAFDTIQGNEVYNITYLSKNKMVLHQTIEANQFNGYVKMTLEKSKSRDN